MKRVCILSIIAAASLTAASNNISWVASNGQDTATCGARNQPCATFQKAHDNTKAGGAVKAVDAADYGIVNITKAITIDGAGTGATILVLPADFLGLVVNAGASDSVTIRGLSILCGSGVIGINVSSGLVHLEDVLISGPASTGLVAAAPLTAERLTVTGAAIAGVSIPPGPISLRDSPERRPRSRCRSPIPRAECRSCRP